MYELRGVFQKPHARNRGGRISLLLALLIFVLIAPAAFAQHVANPFAGATQYVNPDYAAEVNAAIRQTTDVTLANQMRVVATYPTAVWMDHMGAIGGGAGRLSLTQHIQQALMQQKSAAPIVLTLVIYDLPQRDCAALGSHSEISIAANPPTQPLDGLTTYKQNYITPLFNILSKFSGNPHIRFVLIIEPYSLPNLITNTGLNFSIKNCLNANDGMSSADGTVRDNGIYVQGIRFAITQFHTLQNVYQYLDVGQSGWLGWPTAFRSAIKLFTGIVNATPDQLKTIDGFISNTASYVPTKEPFMTALELIGGIPVEFANFFTFNSRIDEADYDSDLYEAFVGAGFPASIGMLIDTSRNGWGGAARPTAASTSTDLNTFTDQSRIDRRNAHIDWCNQSAAGIGVPPTASPGFFPQLQAFVWVKPPGESDGTYATSTAFVNDNADPSCDPAHRTGALPNPPSPGKFFPAEFTRLVQNSFPVVPSTEAPGLAVAHELAAGVERGRVATEGSK